MLISRHKLKKILRAISEMNEFDKLFKGDRYDYLDLVIKRAWRIHGDIAGAILAYRLRGKKLDEWSKECSHIKKKKLKHEAKHLRKLDLRYCQ